jgi:hypothetical protein
MDEDQIPDVLKSERLGHDEPGTRGVHGHVSPAMREELKAALQARWEQSLRQRAALSPVSAVSLLNRLLAGVEPASASVRPICEQRSSLVVHLDLDAGRPDLNLRNLGKSSKELGEAALLGALVTLEQRNEAVAVACLGLGDTKDLGGQL